MKIGRNDPCSCGSGKKYKHCCLANELAVREDASISAITSGLPSGEFASSLPDLDGDVTSPQYWEAMERRLPRKLQKEFEPIIREAKAAIDLEAHHRAIEGAQREREQLALFSEMGLDPDEMRRKGFEGVEEMLQEVMSNPDKTAELEAFLESHPQFKSDMQAECWNSEKPILIDVRSAEEFAEGHLNGALLMPHTQISTMIRAQVPDKNTPIILYCHSGLRAVIAKWTLRSRGYKQVQNFGGMASAGKKLNERVVL